MTLVPLHALYAASMGRFFRAGQNSPIGAVRYAYHILPFPLGYALLIGTAMTHMGQILPWVLGSDYVSSANVLRYLAWLPLATISRDMLQKILVGSGRQQATFIAFAAGGVTNVLLNLWIIPIWEWRGAVLATYLSELAMSIILLIYLIAYIILARRIARSLSRSGHCV
jgi:O-antigen/teichoic acid export membrane protein